MASPLLERFVAYCKWCAVKSIIILIAFQFIIYLICAILADSHAPAQYLFCDPQFWQGDFWRPLTATFTHRSGLQFFLNMLMLFFIGRWFTQTLSKREFWSLILIGGFVANLTHTLIFDHACLGFNGALAALLVACTIKEPRTLIFIFPAWLLVSFLTFLDLIYFLNSLRPNSPPGAAYDVQLFGALFGALMMWSRPLTRRYIKQWNARRATQNQLSNAQDLERVDQILEKISKEGLHKLTDDERKFLKRHSEKERSKQG